jgi:hypothetical protein
MQSPFIVQRTHTEATGIGAELQELLAKHMSIATSFQVCGGVKKHHFGWG